MIIPVILIPTNKIDLCVGDVYLMNAYKVIFKNNVPASAMMLKNLAKALIKFRIDKGRKFIEWYVVFCDSENQALEIAGKVINTIWGKELE